MWNKASAEVFPQERDNIPGCRFKMALEDVTHPDAPTALTSWSDTVHFANFMRKLAPPVPVPGYDSTARGSQLFTQIGCALCHTPFLTTGASARGEFNHKPVPLYSDLALHQMGQGLDDAVSQGNAGTDEFRTAPLWGVGQRLFFMHDGRAANLVDAMAAHASQGSEATQVVNAFRGMQSQQQQDLVNFLRSL